MTDIEILYSRYKKKKEKIKRIKEKIKSAGEDILFWIIMIFCVLLTGLGGGE
jgi:hypothetical protein